MESVHIRSFSGPYFPAFGLNRNQYGQISRSDFLFLFLFFKIVATFLVFPKESLLYLVAAVTFIKIRAIRITYINTSNGWSKNKISKFQETGILSRANSFSPFLNKVKISERYLNDVKTSFCHILADFILFKLTQVTLDLLEWCYFYYRIILLDGIKTKK